MRIADHAALAAAVRNIYNCALEGHPCCQRLDFVVIYRRMETDTALGRSAGCGMLDAVALKYAGASVVHHHRNRYLQLALRILQRLDIALAVAQDLCQPRP